MPPSDADQSDAFSLAQSLPDPLPQEPFGLFREWFDDARSQRIQPNPNAMTLATVDSQGRPSARIVLCKDMNLAPEAGYIVFHTNRQGRKGRELAANPHVAVVFHWDDLDRQVRIEGQVTRASDEESDAYFRTRALESRIGAWASDQSQPIDSRDALLEKVAEVMARFGVGFDNLDTVEIPRPPHWGGFRVWADAVELWMGGPGRVHDRARWTRPLSPSSEGFVPGPWTAYRLQP